MRAYILTTILALAASTITAHPAANPTNTPDPLAPPTALGPSLEEFLARNANGKKDIKRRTNSDTTMLARQSNTTTAEVELCTEPNFDGECTHSIWPVNQCIDLKGYRGVTKSFLPVDGFECLLMQGECDASVYYIEIGDSDTAAGGDLTTLDWIEDATSYICFTEINLLQRFVRVSRLRTMGKKISQ